MIKKRFLLLTLLFLLVMVLVACSNDKAKNEKTTKEVLSKINYVLNKEKRLIDSEDFLHNKERIERALLEEMFDLGVSHPEQIKEKANQALESVESREKRITTEKEKMTKIFESLNEMSGFKKLSTNTQVKKLIDDIDSISKERVNTLNKMFDTYEAATNLDKRLYKLVGDVKTPLKEIEDVLIENREMYKEIRVQQSKYNELTSKLIEKRDRLIKISEYEKKE